MEKPVCFSKDCAKGCPVGGKKVECEYNGKKQDVKIPKTKKVYTLVLREFAEHDWDTFAGAECAADGRKPLMGETQDGSLVIVDKTGINVYAPWPEDPNVMNVDCWWLESTYDLGMVIAQSIIKFDEAQLAKLGFQKF